jgi:hypothetical protein
MSVNAAKKISTARLKKNMSKRLKTIKTRRYYEGIKPCKNTNTIVSSE